MSSLFLEDFLRRDVSQHENFSSGSDLEQKYIQKTTKNLNIKLIPKSVKILEGGVSTCNHLTEYERITINFSRHNSSGSKSIILILQE